MIQIENLEFSYTSEAFMRIPRFKIESGEKVFLAGPSGSGKTTFLEIVSGILQAEKGKCLVVGEDFVRLNPTERDRVRKKSMSLIFQNFNLIPYLSVEKNILLPFWLGFQDERTPEEIQKQMLELLEKLGIEKLRLSSVTQLSQGQAQRVAAARAFLKKPKILLADEPISALDYDHRDQFLKILFDLCTTHQTSLIFVSHDRSLERLFHRTQSVLEWRVK